jgi:hypothetical protein
VKPHPGGSAAGLEPLVIIGGKHWAKDLRWIIACSLVAAVAIVAYGREWLEAPPLPPGGSSRTGFVCGVLGGLIIVFEMLLWPRRRVRAWRLGSAQAWLRAHVWLGLLAVPLVLMHARLLFIGGLLNWALMATFALVIASGVWGLVLQQYLPTMLLEHVPAETIYDQIEHVAAQQARDTERLVRSLCEADAATADDGHEPVADDEAEEADHAVVTGFRSLTGIQGKVLEPLPIYGVIPGTREIRRRFFSEIRPYLLEGRETGSTLASAPAAERFFAGLRGASPPEAGALLEHLARACEHRRQYDLQATIHHWLHGWLLVHVPLSFALLILLLIHVPVALWYW